MYKQQKLLFIKTKNWIFVIKLNCLKGWQCGEWFSAAAVLVSEVRVEKE